MVYHDGKRETRGFIGPDKTTTQYLDLERHSPTKCYVTGQDQVVGLQLVTDDEFESKVGKPGKNRKLLAKGGRKESVEGFYFVWSKTGTPDAVLKPFGLLTRKE
ncbi:hypothetical protein ACHAPU_011375 [Fusarium lateritium]